MSHRRESDGAESDGIKKLRAQNLMSPGYKEFQQLSQMKSDDQSNYNSNEKIETCQYYKSDAKDDDDNAMVEEQNINDDEEDERVRHKFNAARKFYLSTNSGNPQNTIVNPDIGEVLFWYKH